MKQNITATQLDIGLKKMLISEYEYPDDMFKVIIKTLYGVNWTSKHVKEVKKWLEFKTEKLDNDELNIILHFYSDFTNGNMYKVFKLYIDELVCVVEHFIWATWLYL